jgi:hypothetical protein
MEYIIFERIATRIKDMPNGTKFTDILDCQMTRQRVEDESDNLAYVINREGEKTFYAACAKGVIIDELST